MSGRKFVAWHEWRDCLAEMDEESLRMKEGSLAEMEEESLRMMEGSLAEME